MEEIQHEIHAANDKAVRLNEILQCHVAEIKQNCIDLSKELHARPKAVSVELAEH
jgi:hypothetical protein